MTKRKAVNFLRKSLETIATTALVGISALILNSEQADAMRFRGFVHNSENGISGANTPVKTYLKRTGGTTDTLRLVTNNTGRYTGNTFNFWPWPATGDTLFTEIDTIISGSHYTAKTKWVIQNQWTNNYEYIYEIALDNPNKNVNAFTFNIDEFKDTTNYTNSTIAPLFWLKKNPDQKRTTELDTISDGSNAHPHYYDSWGNFEEQDSSWAQGDSARILFQKNYTNKAFPDSIPYSFFSFALDTTMWDAKLVEDTLKFPTNVSIKDWNVDSIWAPIVVGQDSVKPKAFIKNNRASLAQYDFPDSAKFYFRITGPGVDYLDSLIKRIDSGKNDTITFKKCFKGVSGDYALKCSTSTSADATPLNNFKETTVAGPLAIVMAYFGAQTWDKGIKIYWKTESEQDAYNFDVERGINHDTLEFRLIGSVPAHGTTNEPHDYSYYDGNCSTGLNWYRLIGNDIEGKKTTYGPINVTTNYDNETHIHEPFKVFPSPARNLKEVKFSRPGNYTIYNKLGQVVGKADGKSPMNFDVSNGIYFIREKGKDGEFTKKIMIVY